MTESVNRIVWGRPTSSNVMKVLWALGELGLSFERIDVVKCDDRSRDPIIRGAVRPYVE